MLQEYKQYITNLRNNLIQCGVEYPITPLETYEDLFYESSNLEQVLWYYSVMGISNSEGALSDYFIPLTGYFKEKLREQCYANFQAFLEEYKKISALASISVLDIPESVTYSDSNLNESEEVDLFDSEVSEDSDALEDLGDTISNDGYSDDTYSPPVVSETKNGVFLEDLQDIEHSNPSIEVSHGVFLEDVQDTEYSNPSVEEVPHGVFLEEISNFLDETSCVNDDNSVYLIQESPHGIFLEDVPVTESKEEEWEEGVVETSEPVEEDEYSEDWDEEEGVEEYSEPVEDEEEYEDWEEEEGVEEYSEPVEDDEYSEEYEDWEEEGVEEYSEPVEDDEYVEDWDEEEGVEEYSEPVEDDEEYEDWEEEEEGVEEYSEPVEDDEYTEEWDEEEEGVEEYSEPVEDDEYVEDWDEEEEGVEEYSEPVEDEESEDWDEDEGVEEYSEPVDDESEDFDNWTEPQTSSKPSESGYVQSPKQNKDLSDYLQDATNSVLTKGKKFFIKGKQRLKDG